MGVNVIRLQLNWNYRGDVNVIPDPNNNIAGDPVYDVVKYRAWITTMLPIIDQIVLKCRAKNIKILLDLHTKPGGMKPASGNEKTFTRMLSSKGVGDDFYTTANNPAKYREELVTTWETLANRYKNQNDGKVIYAYDIANEPVEPENNIFPWVNLAPSVIDAIRAIDPGKAIVFEPGPYGSPKGFNNLTPLKDNNNDIYKNIIYSIHMYEPHCVTHQAAPWMPPTTPFTDYPHVMSDWRGVYYCEQRKLDEFMVPAINFSIEHDVHIMVGEFGSIRWAGVTLDENGNKTAAVKYIEDAAELFEEYGWDWTCHSFRLRTYGNPFSIEHSTDIDENGLPVDGNGQQIITPRQLSLENMFNANEFD